jgi:UDP:flavonoid glycosyltransferase YjiC (YdhE family)
MRMLFAWELGGNSGHLSRDLPIAERLRDLGHDVSFAVCDLDGAERMLAPAGFAFMACPSLIQPPRREHAPVNYSDILAAHGYAEKSRLSALLRAWVTLLRSAAIDIVVSDFAPTALLAARVLGLRAEVVGPPFSVPPAVSPLPSIRPWDRITHEQLLQADARVLTAMNAALAELGLTALPDVASLYAGIPPHLTHFAELDCYGPRTSANYIGPIAARNSFPMVEWQQSGGKKVFAYLHSDVPGLEPLLQVIQEVGADVICVIAGAPDSMIDRLRRTGLNARNKPVDVSMLLPDADLVVGYGSAGLIAESLLRGVPMLLTPLQIEHHLNALMAAKSGAALLVDEQRTVARFRAALHSVMSESRIREAARVFAEKYRSFDLDAAADRFARRITGSTR